MIKEFDSTFGYPGEGPVVDENKQKKVNENKEENQEDKSGANDNDAAEKRNRDIEKTRNMHEIPFTIQYGFTVISMDEKKKTVTPEKNRFGEKESEKEIETILCE